MRGNPVTAFSDMAMAPVGLQRTAEAALFLAQDAGVPADLVRSVSYATCLDYAPRHTALEANLTGCGFTAPDPFQSLRESLEPL